MVSEKGMEKTVECIDIVKRKGMGGENRGECRKGKKKGEKVEEC